MSWLQAIALDLDGTIALNDVVSPAALDAIKDARTRGLRVALVTGRTADALHRQFPRLVDEFDAVVAENGGVLIWGDRHRLLAEPVSDILAATLRLQGIPIEQGETLLATSVRHHSAVLHYVAELGLDCAVIRNRGELMVLPVGVSKGSGLAAALELFRLSPHNTVAMGDAENDRAMFDAVEFAAAPVNAVSAIAEHADVVLDTADGQGVAELLSGPIGLGEQRPRSRRRQLRIGSFSDHSPVELPSTAGTVLLVGGSGRGKSYLAGLIAEQLVDRGYQALIVDPEGEQTGLADLLEVEVIHAGAPDDADQVVALLEDRRSVVLDLSATQKPARSELLGRIAVPVAALRSETGAPQWILVDEAHDSMCAEGPLRSLYDSTSGGYVLVTYHPEQLCSEILASVDFVVSTSPPVDQMLGATNLPAAGLPRAISGQAVLLDADRAESARPFTVSPRTTGHLRHRRKYAHTLMSPGRGFRFRPIHGKPMPEARSIEQFREQIDRVDPVALAWHMARGDLSRWFSEVVQDRQLANEVGRLERNLLQRQQAETVRAQQELRHYIDRRYPATSTPT